MPTLSDISSLVRKEEARRTRLYQRLSPVLGAFDASEMTLEDMARYGIKRLYPKGPSTADPVAAINSYLDGREQARAIASGAMDAIPGGTFVDRYLNPK